MREQLAQLESLGLNEAEAVEYILMLSRDEAQQHSNNSKFSLEEGIFENFDFDNLPSNSTHIIASSSTSLSRSQPISGTISPKNSHLVPPTFSNEKIRVSPPYRSEPMEAGWGDTSHSSSPSQSPPSSDDTHFPPMSASASPPTPLTKIASNASRLSISRENSNDSQGSGSGPSGQVSVSGSPQFGRSTMSAWASPLRHSPVPVVSSVRPGRSNSGGVREEDMDEELRFALALSLAEARSRGEDV